MASNVMIKNRIISAIRGAFVADAASMGTHWIYDPTEMLKAIPSVEKPEFKSPPTPNYYSSTEFPGHYGIGQLSPYGEQLLFVTEYVASNESDIDGSTMSLAMLDWAESFGGRKDSAMIEFIKNMKERNKPWPNCGAENDSQAHIYMKIIPIVCRYAGTTDLQGKVIDTIKVHQNNPTAIAYGIVAARILEKIILGSTINEALDDVESYVSSKNFTEDVTDPEVLKSIQSSFDKAKTFASIKDETLDDILKQLSNELITDKESKFYNLAARSCALPGSFIGPLVLLFRNTEYVSAIRQNILASGDTCSRSIYLGAIIGAASASDATTDGTKTDNAMMIPPNEWWNKVDKVLQDRIDSAGEKIVEFSHATFKKQKLNEEGEEISNSKEL